MAARGHIAWVWQVSEDYPGAEADDARLPIGEVWIKAFDGLVAQGVYDDHALEVRDRRALWRLRDMYARQGIALGVWAVPHGVHPGYGPAEAADPAWRPPPGSRSAPGGAAYAFREGFAHGAAAVAARAPGDRRAPTLVADVEPSYYGGATPQFWREDRGAGAAEARAYLDGAEAAGAPAVWFSAAFRRDGSALRDVAAAAWLADPRVAGLCPQVYWTDFGGGWRAAFGELDAALAAVGFADYPRERIAPVLPGDAAPADLRAAWAYCRSVGFARPSLWRRGTVSAGAWAALRALRWSEPTAPVAEPTDTPDVSLVDALTLARRRLREADHALGGALAAAGAGDRVPPAEA